MSWQVERIRSAAHYLRERIAAGDSAPRTKVVYEGLLEVLDPRRHTARLQREMTAALQRTAKPTIGMERERRSAQRRRKADRRYLTLGAQTSVERRKGQRRTSRDRRRR